MSRIIIVFSFLCLCCAVPTLADTVRLSTPVTEDALTETFGEVQLASVAPVALETVINHPGEYLDETIAVTTRVAKVCQKKGCFFIAYAGKQTIRVAFKDYAFFVPTDIAGREVTLIGTLIEKERSAAQATHFSEDLDGDSGIAPGKVVEFLASSVRVSKS